LPQLDITSSSRELPWRNPVFRPRSVFRVRWYSVVTLFPCSFSVLTSDPDSVL
jgi:hypothetical protein